jgi:hypothetical protein
MATAAISKGTSASAEPNTDTSTASAATAATSVKDSTPLPCLAWLPLCSSVIPVTVTALPAGRAGRIAAVIFGARLGVESPW